MICVICIAAWSLNTHQIWPLSAERLPSYSLTTCQGDPPPQKKKAKSDCDQGSLNGPIPCEGVRKLDAQSRRHQAPKSVRMGGRDGPPTLRLPPSPPINHGKTRFACSNASSITAQSFPTAAGGRPRSERQSRSATSEGTGQHITALTCIAQLIGDQKRMSRQTDTCKNAVTGHGKILNHWRYGQRRYAQTANAAHFDM